MGMDNLERRVIVLEQQLRHERELSDWRFDALSRQFQAFQTRPLAQVTAQTILKILLAIAIPLTALMSTGDLRRLLMAIRLAVGG